MSKGEIQTHVSKFAAEPGEILKRSASAEEGRRLVRAFLCIKDAALRESVVSLIESMAKHPYPVDIDTN